MNKTKLATFPAWRAPEEPGRPLETGSPRLRSSESGGPGIFSHASLHSGANTVKVEGREGKGCARLRGAIAVFHSEGAKREEVFARTP